MEGLGDAARIEGGGCVEEADVVLGREGVREVGGEITGRDDDGHASGGGACGQGKVSGA